MTATIIPFPTDTRTRFAYEVAKQNDVLEEVTVQNFHAADILNSVQRVLDQNLVNETLSCPSVVSGRISNESWEVV